MSFIFRTFCRAKNGLVLASSVALCSIQAKMARSSDHAYFPSPYQPCKLTLNRYAGGMFCIPRASRSISQVCDFVLWSIIVWMGLSSFSFDRISYSTSCLNESFNSIWPSLTSNSSLFGATFLGGLRILSLICSAISMSLGSSGRTLGAKIGNITLSGGFGFYY